jgi:hypothetical protein
MACVRKEIRLNASADAVWAALADFHAVHTKLATGFVVDSKPDPGPTGDARIVTFANGTSAREILVDRDDKARRLVYAVVGNDRLQHHSASAEIVPEAGGCRFIWTSDFLPNEVAPYIDAQMGQGAAAMKQNLECAAAAAE